MDSNFKVYDPVDSFKRIDEILDQPQGNYEEVKALPDRDDLTFTNGFYSYCSALFIDIRDSSKLPDVYKRPALAKLYRAYISEMVAIFNSASFAREINIVGDCVWGIYNTTQKAQIDEVFSMAAKANTLVKILNYKLGKHGYPTPIQAGLGMSYGRALMIKAGLSGSGINDVVYMGDVVNKAAKLAARGNVGWNDPLQIDDDFRLNLNESNKAVTTVTSDRECYEADVVNTLMNDWYTANCT